MKKPRTPVLAALMALAAPAILLLLPCTGSAQKRDDLTDAESELIRFHRELDKRIEVFIKAAARRFAVINGTPQPGTKKLLKDEPDWGEPPKGSRAELLSDIAGILDEAITNIDDVSRHDEKSPLIPRALKKLSIAANTYIAAVTNLGNQTKDANEIAAIDRLLDNAAEIIEAAAKVPAPPAEKKKNNQ